MLNKLRALLSQFQIKSAGKCIDTPVTPTHAVDSRAASSRKAVAGAFKEQEKRMESQRMIAHDFYCENPALCIKSPCYIWKPDKVVGKPMKVKLKTKEQREKELDGQHPHVKFSVHDVPFIKRKPGRPKKE